MDQMLQTSNPGLSALIVVQMGGEDVHTPFLTDLNKATLDVVPVVCQQDAEEKCDGRES